MEDERVIVDGKRVFLVEFPIGDWSGDGHKQCEYYVAVSEKPVEDIREAHFKAPEIVGFEIGDICRPYEDSILERRFYDKLRELGYDFDLFDEDNEKEDGIELDEEGRPGLSPYGVFRIWLFLLNYIDPSLRLEALPIRPLNFFGCDEEGRYLRTPGYGTFGA